MEVTVLGIVTDIFLQGQLISSVTSLLYRMPSLEQNAVLLGCTFIVSSWLQSKYLQPVITQYFASNKSEIWSLPLRVHSKGEDLTFLLFLNAQ